MTIVTADNIEQVREEVVALDQREELVVGCETWPVWYQGGQRGQMTVYPYGRAAIYLGGNSMWGDWDANARTLHLDDGSGEVYDETGTRVDENDLCN